MSLALGIERLHLGNKTLVEQAISVLRKFGSNAHLYFPGVGRVSSIDSGNYLLSDGSSGYSPVDGLQGLCLDGMGAVGSELVPSDAFTNLANWQFTSCTGAFVGGKLVVTATASTAITAKIIGSYANPETFLASHTISQMSAAVVRYIRGNNIFSGGSSSTATETRYVTSSNANELAVFIMPATAGQTFTIDNISVKQVTGIHATASGAARPTLRRGAYNYLLNSVLAGGTSGTEGSGAVAPTNWVFAVATGSITFSSGAARFVATAQRPMLTQTTSSLAVGSYIFSAKIESGSHGRIDDCIGFVTIGATLSALTFKKNNVTVTSLEPVSAGDLVSVLFSVTVAGTAAPRLGLGCAGASTGDITMSSPQLELGSVASDYTPTTTAAASNSTAGRYSSQFSGAQSLTLGSVPFQANDDFLIVAAGNPTSAAAFKIIYGQSNVASATDSLPYLAFTATNQVIADFNGGGTNTSCTSVATYTNTPVVVSCRKVGSAVELRVNGVQVATTTTSGTYTTATNAKIGTLGRTSDTAFFTGSLGDVLPLKGTFTDADRLTVERLVASQFPNAPSF